jgi:glycosyltransferase involved in cell wall biosynthesis
MLERLIARWRPSRREAADVDVVVLMSGPLDIGVSGGDVHALRLCGALASRGNGMVRLIAPRTMREHLPADSRDCLLELRTPLDGRLNSMSAYFLAVTARMFQALRLAPASRIAVASTHFFFDVVPAAVLKAWRGTRVVAYAYHLVVDSTRPPGLRNWLASALERLSLTVLRRAADLVFVDNEETREGLLRRGFSSDQLAMTLNAYDPLLPMPPRVERAEPLLLFTGRLVKAKGVWDLLALARALRDGFPAARLVVLGDGALREPLQQASSAAGLPNVDFLGFVSEDEKWHWLRQATLFVFPSREEGWGIAVGEALTAGVPVLVYDLPAYRHLGNVPMRVPPGDVDAFVAAALGLLGEPERLTAARLELAGHVSELPRWDEVTAEDIRRMERLRPSTKMPSTGRSGEG